MSRIVIHLLFAQERPKFSHDRDSFSFHRLAKDPKDPSREVRLLERRTRMLKGSKDVRNTMRRDPVLYNAKMPIIIEIIRASRVSRCIKTTIFLTWRAIMYTECMQMKNYCGVICVAI